MKPLSVGSRLFLSITAIFVALTLVFLAYLRFDLTLSDTLRDDAVFLWFALALGVVLVLVLLWYSRKMDNSLARTSSQENAQMRRELTQNISHELKTPVAGIQGYLETVLDTPDMPEETRRAFLERSLTQTRRLSAMLNDLSVLNRMDDAASMYPLSPIDLSEILSMLRRETATAFQKRRMTLTLDVPDMIDINANETLIYSIFRNLLDNALAYAGEGSTVTIRARRAGSFWQFTFADNGPGIASKHYERIFERFYRLDSGRSRSTGGTGLGLAIVKNAVQLHGGSITASSNNPGLRFDFTLRK